jgi:hypothetical protein
VMSDDAKTKLVELAKQQNDYMRRRFSTKYSQYSYKVGQIQLLHNLTYGLVWIYFILAAFYLGILFVGPNRKLYSYKYKGLILLALVLFPYVITPIEYFFVRLFVFLTETTVGNVYERDDHEYVVDYTYVPNLFSY